MENEMAVESTDRTNDNGDYIVICDGAYGSRQHAETQARVAQIIDVMMATMRRFGVYGEARVVVVDSQGRHRQISTRDTY